MTTFRRYKIQPAGRNKYGNYYSTENVKSNLTYAMYGGNVSTEEIPTENPNQDTGSTQPQKTYILFMLSTQGSFNGEDIAISARSETSRVVSYSNNTAIPSVIANFSNSADTFYGITGYAESGMTINILDSGTSATTLEVIVDANLNRSNGKLHIPCYVPKNGEEGMMNWNDWKSLFDDGSLFYQEFEWSWSVSSDATSIYLLDLTNEIASVNCDADGNVVSGAILPTTQARLFFGDHQVSGASYSISIPSAYHASGVSFNTQTGVLSFTSELAFEGTTLEVPITGTYAGIERSKTFTLNKNIPGRDGQSGQTAVSKWLVPTADEIVYDYDTSAFTPNQISCAVWMQEGGDTPVDITSAETVWYRTDLSSSWTEWNKQPIQIASTAWTGVYFGLATPSFEMYEQEDVPIIRNGERGLQGPQGSTGPMGLPGAAIRGPIDWYSGITENRRFCNVRGPNSGDTEFIDILLKDGTYYRCDISYDAHPSDSWSSVSSAWTPADASYDFVATNLLLADNAKIKFLTNNALYLMSGNTITGGAIGGSGDTVAFWAGSSDPNAGNFRVTHNGEITANKGTFAGYVRMPYTFISDLSHNSSGYIADERAYLIADSQSTTYGMGDGGMLILPNPSSSLNGFTYHIIAWPNFGTKTTGLTPSISIMTASQNASISVLAYSDATLAGEYKRLSFYGGHIEITCAPYHYTDRQSGQIVVGYKWIVTMCTGGVDLYNNTGPRASGGIGFAGSYTTLCGYSPNDMYYAPIKVQTDGFQTQQGKRRDTIYIDV